MELSGKRRLAALTAVVVAAGLAAWLIFGRSPGSVLATGPVSATSLGIVAEIRNGTNRSGLARQAARLLREQGVDVVFVGTATARPDSTTVLVRRGNVYRGHEVARLLGGARVRSEPDSLLRVDVTVLLGADYRFPKGRLIL